MRHFIEKLKNRRGRDDKSPSDDSSQDDRSAAETGLKIICESSSSSVDIVAIHGDGGHYKNSWTHPDSQVFWLRDLLPSIIPESRVLSFGYSASKLGFVPAEEICRRLLRELSEMRQDPSTAQQTPIIFLAHSFGVLLMKAVIAMSSLVEFDSIKSSTRGIIFFGSPPDISHGLQSLMSSSSLSTTTAEPSGLTAMKKDIIWLQDMESRYNELEKEGQFEVTYFLESADGEREHYQMDSKHEKYIRMRKSHAMMIRFSSAEDEDFRLVEERMQQIMRNGIMN